MVIFYIHDILVFFIILTVCLLIELIESQQDKPAKLQCSSNLTLTVVSLTLLDSNLAIIPEDDASIQCHNLSLLTRQLGNQCNGKSVCVVDLRLMKLTQENCPAFPFISIDVYCSRMPPLGITVCLAN